MLSRSKCHLYLPIEKLLWMNVFPLKYNVAFCLSLSNIKHTEFETSGFRSIFLYDDDPNLYEEPSNNIAFSGEKNTRFPLK